MRLGTGGGAGRPPGPTRCRLKDPTCSGSHSLQAILKLKEKEESERSGSSARTFLPLAALRSRPDRSGSASRERVHAELAEVSAQLAHAQSVGEMAAAERTAERTAARAQLRDLEAAVEAHQALLHEREEKIDALQRELDERAQAAAAAGRPDGEPTSEAVGREAVAAGLVAERDAAIAAQVAMAAELRLAEGKAKRLESEAKQLMLDLQQSILERKQTSEQSGGRTAAPFGFKSPFRGSGKAGASATPPSTPKT